MTSNPSSNGMCNDPHISSETSRNDRSPDLICFSRRARCLEPQPRLSTRTCPLSCRKMVPSKSGYVRLVRGRTG